MFPLNYTLNYSHVFIGLCTCSTSSMIEYVFLLYAQQQLLSSGQEEPSRFINNYDVM